MKRELIVTAKTVEEARAKVVAELGVNEDEIEFTVLEEGKKGFFGIGATEAKVSAVYQVKGGVCALEFVRKIVADMELELEVTMQNTENGDVMINVQGEGAGQLIGHHGETLDALQYLASLAANKKVKGEKRDYVKISLNVEGYREKREASLRALARRMANKVIKDKKSVMLEPMNPYERRIIHSEVQGIDGVSTNSIGSENNRRVVMFLDDSKQEKED